MFEQATKGDEKHRCPRCKQFFREGERIDQSRFSPVRRERRAVARGVEWAHLSCPKDEHHA